MSNSSETANAVAVDEQNAISGGVGNDEESFLQKKVRYVGPKETVAYVVYDMTCSFNINIYSERFVTNILQLSFNLQTIANLINGIWDIVNDIFSAAIVDKTRTRLGKFRPYLLFLSVPGAIGTILYWLQPVFFAGATQSSMSKFIFYLVLAIIREGVGTFQGFAQTGLLATITPHPLDRTRLITLANFFSGFLGEKLPEQIMTILLDLIGNKVLKWSIKNLFVFMGIFTTVVGSAAAIWFFWISKERVMQSVDSPSVKQGVKSIINNKPILLLTLSDMLSNIGLSGSKSNYFIDVLNFASLGLFTGIPGAIVHPISYTMVPWFRRHFSSKVLFIFGKYIGNILLVPVFLVGSIGGKRNGLYKRIGPMAVMLTLWETLFMLFYGVRKVIPSELYNESIDYCEWKNGYRSEAMISAAKGLATKLASLLSSLINTQFKKLIGYDMTKYVKGTAQTDYVKFWLFAMYTIIPFLTSSFGIIPMLFYDLSGEKRDRMYEELLARRSEFSSKATAGDAAAIEEIAKAQREIENENKNKKL